MDRSESWRRPALGKPASGRRIRMTVDSSVGLDQLAIFHLGVQQVPCELTRSYNRKLWMPLRTKAAYLPG